MAKRKVPKRIAGIKVPKQLRKGAIGVFLASSGGQVLLGEALLVLASVLTVSMAPSTTTGRRLRDALTDSAETMLAAGGGKGARHRARARARAISSAVDEAMNVFRASLAASESEHHRDTLLETRDGAAAIADGVKKKALIVQAVQAADAPLKTELEERPTLGEKIRERAERWLLKYMKRRLRRELREYGEPEINFHPFERVRPASKGRHVYRSLVQIHFHPRSN